MPETTYRCRHHSTSKLGVHTPLNATEPTYICWEDFPNVATLYPAVLPGIPQDVYRNHDGTTSGGSDIRTF